MIRLISNASWTISVPSGAKTDRDVNAAIDLIEAEVEKLDEAIRNRMDEIANLIDDAGYGPEVVLNRKNERATPYRRTLRVRDLQRAQEAGPDCA